MRIAPWQPGDEVQIVKLFSSVFNQNMSPEFWRWRYCDHPAGDPLVCLAWDGDRLAAHYAASHGPLLINGEKVAAAQSMTTMTHPDYRGQGLLERTATALYDELQRDGVAAVWGFPNNKINVSRRRKLNWDAVADLPTLSRQIKPEENLSDCSLVTVDRIDARFDNAKSSTVTLSMDHSHEILSWRIDQNPMNRYIRLVLQSGDSLDGFAILKPFKDGEFDLVLLQANDARAYPDLIMGSLAHIQSLSGTRLNCWSLPQDETRIPLERAGFQATMPVTYFGGRVLKKITPEFSDARNWRVSMIDSDLF